MYGMPQSNSYSQYGFGYPGFGQGDASASAQAGTGTQSGTAGNGGQSQGQQAAGQAGQAQWGTDPSFYQNYWGGECVLMIIYLPECSQVIMDNKLVRNSLVLHQRVVKVLKSN